MNEMAIMAAQASSLGFSLVFGTKYIPAMLWEKNEEAKSIVADTHDKVCLRVDELEQTVKLAIDPGGKGMEAQLQGWSGKSGEMSTTYSDGMEAHGG